MYLLITIVDAMDGFIYGEVVSILGSDGDNSVSDSDYLSDVGMWLMCSKIYPLLYSALFFE